MDRATLDCLPAETIEEGCYRRLASTANRFAAGQAAVFLDRDGVLVRDCGYLWRPDEAELLPGVAEAIQRLNAAGLPVVVVSNQAGIARGLFDWLGFQGLMKWLEVQIGETGAWIDAVYACAYHPEGQPPFDIDRHPWRKPRGGMLMQAAADLRIDLARSWLVGDHLTDIQAALAAGLAGAVHVATGHGPAHREAVEALRPDFDTAIETADDLAGAVAGILARFAKPV